MSLVKRYTSLPEHLVLFSRYLRHQGFYVDPDTQQDALWCLSQLPFYSESNFKLLLRSVISKNYQQLQQFEKHYYEFWEEQARASDSKVKPSNRKQQSKKGRNHTEELKDWLYGNQLNTDKEISVATYSPFALKMKQDLGEFSDHELADLNRLIHRLSKLLARRYKNRFFETSKTRELDFRKTIRYNLRRGNNWLDLKYHQKEKEKHRLIIICDVSKSMDLYSRFFIRFIYAFQQVYRDIESFVFSTALYHVTSRMKHYEFRNSITALQDLVEDWSGGTLIGPSMQEFLESYAHLLSKKSVVIIVSDGWDAGPEEELEDALRVIRKKSGQLIWLNPLMGSPDFKPETAGMKIASRYADKLLPCHNLESLKNLVNYL